MGSLIQGFFSMSNFFSTIQSTVGGIRGCETTYMDRGIMYMLTAGYKLY